jgi:hypothetical protein
MAATKDQVAQLIVGEAKARNHTREECLGELSALYQESQLDETVWDPTHTTYGVAQQDSSYANRFQGAAAQVKAFFVKLDVKRTSPGHGDIWLNICWLQQAPNWPSAQYWWEHGRQAYLAEIKSRIATVTPYLDKYWPNEDGGTPVGWTGDPVWLEDVLRARPLLAGKVRTLDGWQDRGHGDFADVWGVLWHHTGNGRATAESIRDGRPDLAGPVSNIHIAQDGTVTVVAVGVAWHAGEGSGFGLPANNANNRLIGIECAWPMDTTITPATQTQERWPDAQIIAMREVAAALTLKLGYDAGRNIGHKEWAGAAQGKWDPGNLDMNWFRGEVAKSMAGQFDPTTSTPPPVVTPPPTKSDRLLLQEIWDQLRIEWPQLGGQTVVNALAEVRDKVCGTNDKDKS